MDLFKRINRIRLEFKGLNRNNGVYGRLCINRIRLEFKDGSSWNDVARKIGY